MNEPLTAFHSIPVRVDRVQLENAIQGVSLREQGDFLNRIEHAQATLESTLLDLAPAFTSTGLLAVLLFLTVYALRPVPSIHLPGIGAFGVPSNRKRKARLH